MSRSKELILLAQRIRALSQTGLVYSLSEYDTERYEELSRLSDEITALATGLKPDDVASGYRPAQEYVTPKVDIRAVVFNEKDEILLVREKMDGCWSLPGGWSDVGYSPKEVAAKEVKEETGLDVLPVRLLAVMDMSKHPHPAIPYYVYKFFILCELKGGSFTETFDKTLSDGVSVGFHCRGDLGVAVAEVIFQHEGLRIYVRERFQEPVKPVDTVGDQDHTLDIGISVAYVKAPVEILRRPASVPFVDIDGGVSCIRGHKRGDAVPVKLRESVDISDYTRHGVHYRVLGILAVFQHGKRSRIHPRAVFFPDLFCRILFFFSRYHAH